MWCLATYIILVAGIWMAFLWVVYSTPLVIAPVMPHAVVGAQVKTQTSSTPQLSLVETGDSKADDHDGDTRPLVAISQVVQFTSVPLAEPSVHRPLDSVARRALVLEIQRALVRIGCYRGPVTGIWAADTKNAVKAFLSVANARLPIDKPDDILLHLVKGGGQLACGEVRHAAPLGCAHEITIAQPLLSKAPMGLGGPKTVTITKRPRPPTNADQSDVSTTTRSREYPRRGSRKSGRATRAIRVPAPTFRYPGSYASAGSLLNRDR